MAAYELFFLGGRRRKAVTPNMGSHDQGLEPLCTSPEAISSDTAGFCDLDLSLDDFKRLSDGSQCLCCAGMYNGSRFDFEVVFGPVWQGDHFAPVIFSRPFRV